MISMRIRICPAIVVFSVFAIVSCGKIDSLPVEPHIKYTSFTVFDTTDLLGNTVKGGRLKFYFEDGDGNVGLPPPSAEDETFDSINLFLNLFRVNNDSVTPAPENDPFKPTGYRIPYMERTGQNKILKGDISVVIMYLFYSKEDSIKYDFYIKDRDENLSNVDSTGIIPLFYNGTYGE
jgi:hypothetical protein